MPLFDRLGTAGTVALVGIGLVLRTILREVRLPTLVPLAQPTPQNCSVAHFVFLNSKLTFFSVYVFCSSWATWDL